MLTSHFDETNIRMHVTQTEHEVAKKHEEKRTPSAGEPSLGWDKARFYR